ncbi:aconitase X catalytic domain-containing protein [Methanohalobium sp.]|uniref:aconitase X catalytic domain-containing protein n=1 Tax=Methanohalobium sp. TaxID=2837493 RepID=UPI0025D37C95|nr:aconitase X catalytic domain-containing protein [Methanohalobium sp.]
MHLTKEEEQILNGEHGETLQKAIEILVALGDIYDADGLIPIKSAQIAGVSYKTIGDAGLEWISDLEGEVKVPAILNPAGMDLENWNEMDISKDFARKQQEIIDAYRKLGVNTKCTCTPYYLEGFDTEYGDHLAWSESSAVSYANSVIGARTNREGGPSALSAALIGKTANYGYHLDENRIPDVSITVECELTGSDYGALGYQTGMMVGNRVPLFHLKNTPSSDELKALGASMAATGAVALYHVDGVTPETQNIGFEQPSENITIEADQIQEVYNTNSDIQNSDEIIALGCPHCSGDELEYIAQLLDNKQVDRDVWICTSREVADKNSQIIDRIEKSGAMVVCDTCMIVSPASENYNMMMVNSGKALNYVPGMCKIPSKFGSIMDCIREAGDNNRNNKN